MNLAYAFSLEVPLAPVWYRKNLYLSGPIPKTEHPLPTSAVLCGWFYGFMLSKSLNQFIYRRVSLCGFLWNLRETHFELLFGMPNDCSRRYKNGPYICCINPVFVLQHTFMALVARYTSDVRLAETLWQEIEKYYSHKKRQYHGLLHVEKLLEQLAVHTGIEDWDTLLFALYYHDIIYKATRSDNEEKSAELARERLTKIGYPPEKTARCVAHILATRSHTTSADADTNLFTDADLSILGADAETYQNYTRQIRAEYSIYPDFIYMPGRKKVLQHFLQMEHIYKTDYFRSAFEEQARRNLQEELGNLI